MMISPEWLGIVVFAIGQTLGGVWWASRLTARVEATERWQSENHEVIKRVAGMEQAILDLKGWLERIHHDLSALRRGAE
jgi:hypothetical protein